MPRYEQDPRSSTFYDPSAALTNYQQLVPVVRKDGQIDYYVDMLDHKLLAAIANIKEFNVVRYDGNVHITTLSKQAYETTSYWWVIMFYNGFVHPLEIEPGFMIKLPDQAELEENLQDNKQEYEPGSQTIEI